MPYVLREPPMKMGFQPTLFIALGQAPQLLTNARRESLVDNVVGKPSHEDGSRRRIIRIVPAAQPEHFFIEIRRECLNPLPKLRGYELLKDFCECVPGPVVLKSCC